MIGVGKFNILNHGRPWLGLLISLLVATAGYAQDQLGAAEGILNTDERVQYEELIKQRATLNRQLEGLRGSLAQVGNDFDKLLEGSKGDVLSFSDRFYDYKIARLIFTTNLTYRLAKELNEKVGLRSETFAKIDEQFQKFKAATQAVPRLSDLDPNSKEYQAAKENSAAVFDSINPPHRNMIDYSVKLADELKVSTRLGVVERLWRYFSNLIQPLREAIANLQYKAIRNILKQNRSIFSPIEKLLKLKYTVLGYELPSEFKNAFRAELQPGQINIIIAPHGGPEEVALTGARIANALPAGRKAAILLAAYHFVPNTNEGLEMANLIANHPDFIAVLAETSPFADRAKTERVDIQIKNAMERGVTDVIIFTEGRNTSRGGGFTPANMNTMRLLRLLPRQKVNIAGVEQRIEPLVTMVSANFSNRQFGIGVGRDPLFVGVEQEFNPEVTTRLAKDPGALAALFDVAWNLKATAISPDRLGSTAPEQQILEEIAGPYLSTTRACSDLLEGSVLDAPI